MTAVDIEELDAAIAAATPPLTDDDRRLVRGLLAALARGVAPTATGLADDLGLDHRTVETRLDQWPGVFRDESGAVIGFWGIALPEMPHALRFVDGAAVHAWCAWDPLFLAPIAGEAEVATRDPVSGATIRYRVGPTGVTGADAGQVVSFLRPDDTWTKDVLGSFCHHVLHFTDETTGAAWTAEHPGTFLLPLDVAAELGRRHAHRIAGT